MRRIFKSKLIREMITEMDFLLKKIAGTGFSYFWSSADYFEPVFSGFLSGNDLPFMSPAAYFTGAGVAPDINQASPPRFIINL